MCLILTHGSSAPRLVSAIHKSAPSLNSVGWLSMTNPSRAATQASATCLLRECLQIFTGDREQTRPGTGGDQLRESSLKRLSHKSIGFLGGPLPRLPSEMVASFASALADETTFSQIGVSGDVKIFVKMRCKFRFLGFWFHLLLCCMLFGGLLVLEDSL